MDIKTFVNITSRAWALPILSSMYNGVPGRQAPLLVATGASRTAFAQSMDHLIECGLVERNPGHGHPLRPEFRLTQFGKSVAPIAHQIQSVSSEQDQVLIRKTWTLPILTTLQSPRQFSEIRRSLNTITDRALSHSLISLEDRNWVRRDVINTARPPRPIYSAINIGGEISTIIAPQVSLTQQ